MRTVPYSLNIGSILHQYGCATRVLITNRNAITSLISHKACYLLILVTIFNLIKHFNVFDYFSQKLRKLPIPSMVKICYHHYDIFVYTEVVIRNFHIHYKFIMVRYYGYRHKFKSHSWKVNRGLFKWYKDERQ